MINKKIPVPNQGTGIFMYASFGRLKDKLEFINSQLS